MSRPPDADARQMRLVAIVIAVTMIGWAALPTALIREPRLITR